MTFEDAVNFLESLAGFGIRPGLQRITKLLQLLDDPQNKYKTIHVTGTNGKGSVCAMLSQILKTANIRVGLFTSPHLVTYRERIRINNEDISEGDFAALVDEVKACIAQMIEDGNESPTLFETLTAMAFKYFADQKVEYAVIEVGLGGLLDSTNVITPEVSIITNVANDHAEKCGGDLLGIARYKAGIIKQDVPVVTGAEGEPLKIIRDTAQKNHSKIFVLGEDFFVDESLELSLKGEYQKLNAAIAIKSVQVLKDSRVTDSVINVAIKNTHWAGRFEILNINGKTIIIDGAHNGAGAEALRKSLDKNFPTGRRTFLFGVLRDKDIDTIIENLFRSTDFVIVTRPDSERAAEPESVCQRLQTKGIKSISIKNNDEALKIFLDRNEEVLISAGSLYLIGNIRKLLKKMK